MIRYKELVNGEVFTSNNDRVIDVFTKEELEVKKPYVAWWFKVLKTIR